MSSKRDSNSLNADIIIIIITALSIFWGSKWQPTPVLLPGKCHGQRSLEGYCPWGHKRVGHNLVTKQLQQKGTFTLLLLQLACTAFPPTGIFTAHKAPHTHLIGLTVPHGGEDLRRRERTGPTASLPAPFLMASLPSLVSIHNNPTCEIPHLPQSPSSSPKSESRVGTTE